MSSNPISSLEHLQNHLTIPTADGKWYVHQLIPVETWDAIKKYADPNGTLGTKITTVNLQDIPEWVAIAKSSDGTFVVMWKSQESGKLPHLGHVLKEDIEKVDAEIHRRNCRTQKSEDRQLLLSVLREAVEEDLASTLE